MKKVIDLLKEISNKSKRGMSVKDAIDDLMELIFNNLALRRIRSHNGEDFFKDGDLCLKDGYVNPMTRYKNDLECWHLLGEAAVSYINHVKDNPPFIDHFNVDYGSKTLNTQLGQFLTPTKVAEGLLKLINPTLDDEPCVVSEMCCGGGSLVLAGMREFMEKTPNRMNKLHMVVMDKDIHMIHMTTAQIVLPALLHNIEFGSLAIHHGDAITEYYKPTLCCMAIPKMKNYRDLQDFQNTVDK